MVRLAFIVRIVNTLYRFAVNADGPAGMLQRTRVRVPLFLGKTLAACIIGTSRMFSANQYIALTAAFTLVILAIFHSAIQLCHNITSC